MLAQSSTFEGGLPSVGKRGTSRPSPTASDVSAQPYQGSSVGLFVSILVRYPEVASVTYCRDSHSLRLTFLLRESLSEERSAAWRSLLEKSVRAYTALTGRTVRLFDVQVKVKGTVTVIEMWRDVDSLTQGELSVVLSCAAETFGDRLVVDQVPHIEMDELAAQEEIIEEMLEDLRESRHQPSLIAFREEGRVLVYNQ